MRLSIATPPTFDPLPIAISPDGEKVVFIANTESRALLWLYHMKSGAAEAVPGTDNAQFPFWSPDSRSVGFAASGQLKRLDLDSGVVRKLANAPLFLGGTWSRDGTILFVPSTNSRVFRVADTGGDPVAVTPGRPQTHDHFPQALPDGKHFLYYETDPQQPGGVYVSNSDGTTSHRLLDTDAAATYAPPDHLLFVRKGTLWAQHFDPISVTVDGTPIQVVDQIVTRVFAGARVVSVSASGTGSIIYRSGFAMPPLRADIKWRDRSGRELEGFSEASFPVLNPSLSPDDTKLAMFRGADIWLLSLRPHAWDKFTFSKGLDFAAVWSPDGSRIVFSSDSNNVLDLYIKSASGAGGEETLLATPEPKDPTDWSFDGKYLLYRTLNPRTTYDIWALSMADRRPFPVLATEHEERDAQFSPDATMIAYQSNETGRFEVWVRPFPFPGIQVKPDDKVQISTSGGTQVRWSRDGTEIVYMALDGMLMSVPVRIDSRTRALTKGAPAKLFSLGWPLWSGGTGLPFYAISSDGKRFLTTTAPQPPITNPINVLINWRRGSQ